MTDSRKEELEAYEKVNGYKGDKILYLNKEEVIGEKELIDFSTSRVRHLIAESIGVKEYDNWCIVRKDGSIVDASKVRGLFDGDKLIDSDFGSYESKMYQEYLKGDNHICNVCGK